MRTKNAFIIAAALQIPIFLNSCKQNGNLYEQTDNSYKQISQPNEESHHEHYHTNASSNAEFRVMLPRSQSYVLVDVDLLSSNGEATVAFIKSLSPVSNCAAFDTMGLSPHSTNRADKEKAALHIFIHMGGATKENIDWLNTVVKAAKSEWAKKQQLQKHTVQHLDK